MAKHLLVVEIDHAADPDDAVRCLRHTFSAGTYYPFVSKSIHRPDGKEARELARAIPYPPPAIGEQVYCCSQCGCIDFDSETHVVDGRSGDRLDGDTGGSLYCRGCNDGADDPRPMQGCCRLTWAGNGVEVACRSGHCAQDSHRLHTFTNEEVQT